MTQILKLKHQNKIVEYVDILITDLYKMKVKRFLTF